MKPILFAKGETDFTTNGLGRLDCISCKVIEERNGMFELEAEIPVSSAHAGEIEQLSIIGAKAHDGGNIQAFTVYKITKPMNGRFMVYARHLSYRLSDIPCSPFTVAASPQAAANTLAGLKNNALEPCPFNFSTDVTTGNPYTQNVPASIRQRLGGVEGSVLDQFGGEFEYDNWNVKLWKSRGRLSNVTGISLRYGKNITDINQEEEIASTVTGVVPYWIDTDGNNLVTLPEHVVYADNAANYPYHITQVLDLSSEFEEKPTVAQLRGIANAYVHKDGFGVPKVSIKVSFANLWESEEYKDIAPLERVQLCDEVSVYFEKLGISSIAKVVKTDFDVLKERYNNVEVGSLRTTLAQAVTDRDKDIDTTFIQEMTRVSTAITNATAWLTNANGYVVAVKNTDGSWKELLFMNTNDPQTATQGIRFNNNGIGFWNKATDGGNVLDGPYGTAWTIDGRLGDFADKNFWNIRTGDFSLSASATVGGQTVQQIADAAQAAAEATAAAALATAVRSIDGDIEDLQDQIDGNVTTWYYSGVPTLNNLPASEWTTTTDKDNHIGDIYYDSATGYAYRFMKDGNNYVWVKLSDSDIAAALAAAQTAQDTADHKRRVFITQPVPPYDVGDLWTQGSNGDLLRCATAKTASQAYAASDWVLASKYTDDTYVQSWITNTYASDKSNLEGQIDGKAETWYQSADPSTAWTDDTTRNKHLGDLWYKTSDNTTWFYTKENNVYLWKQENVPTAVFDKIDGKAQIFTTQPTPPYNLNDLWCEGPTGDILTCVTAKTTGQAYAAADWVKKNKYTDDSAVTALNNALTQEEIFNRLTNNGQTMGIYLDSQDNKLYINATYIKTGELSANRIKGGTLTLGGNNNVNGAIDIKNATGSSIGAWNKDGLTMNSGSINLANNFIVNSSGEMTAKLGKFGVLNIDSSNSTIYAEGTITFFNEDIELSSSNKRFYYDLIIDTSYLSASTYINMIYTMYAGAFADSIGSVTLYRYYENGSISTIQTVSVITYVDTQTYQFSQLFSPNNGLYLIRFNLNYRNNIRSLNFKIQTSGTIKSLLINKNDGVIAPAFKGQVRGRIQATDFSCGGWHFEGYNKRDLIFGEIDSDQNYLRVSPFWGITINDADVSPKQTMHIKTDDIFRYEGSTYYYLNWQGGSDRRIKENIIDLNTELSRKLIDGTVAKRFKYIASDGIHYGMIAQEARKVLDSLGETEAVLEYSPTKGREEETIKDLRAIRYEEYIPHIINYIKDLRAVVNRQQAEIDQLKEIVKKLSM